ncbi:MAG: RNA-binding protein [DPANN group archaeon]|nr:RNA-binding protein [DPANN group archaeon]
MDRKCVSCKSNVTNDRDAASFPCPSCLEQITRCGHCRKTATQYKCNCKFEGP